MTTRLYIRTYDLSRHKLPADIRKWCKSRTLKYEDKEHTSLIGEELNRMIKTRQGHVYIAHDGNRRLGWGINYKQGQRKEFQCYILRSARRRGIATRILEKATANVGAVNVYSHELSSEFFEAHGLTYSGKITGKRLKRKVKNAL